MHSSVAKVTAITLTFPVIGVCSSIIDTAANAIECRLFAAG
jgi:hypothetical protein